MADREAELSNNVAESDERAGKPDADELTGGGSPGTGGPEGTAQSRAQESMTDDALEDNQGNGQARNPI